MGESPLGAAARSGTLEPPGALAGRTLAWPLPWVWHRLGLAVAVAGRQVDGPLALCERRAAPEPPGARRGGAGAELGHHAAKEGALIRLYLPVDEVTAGQHLDL